MPAPRPLIAIVGSLDPERADDLGLTDLAGAEAACQALGRELAAAGMNVLVYSASSKFVEAAVVAGYVAQGSAPKQSIQVRLPLEAAKQQFPEQLASAELFDVRPDPSTDWRDSYYRSLQETDGVILLGGGNSTYVTGMIALAFSIPIVALTTFGGQSKQVWDALHTAESDVEREEISVMARSWDDAQAARLVASLAGQAKRRSERLQKDERAKAGADRRATIGLLVGLVLLALCGVAIAIGYSQEPGSGLALGLLLGTPLLAAASGAIMRCGLDETDRWLRSAALGGAAGFITSMLFIGAQFLTTPDLLESAEARRLLFLVVPIAFIAGVGFESVYGRFKETNVVNTGAVVP
ncbi:hypothetical protein OJ998_09780 [Solirubrobacter taibaiensis]|nr:hypothetical protein [Solirubrobacter taibaiensis]